MSPCGPLLPFLLGDWDIRRHLVDIRLGLEGRFEGTARFAPDGPRAAGYHEQGILTWPGHAGPAYRSLRCASSGEHRVAFSFTDGRPFHVLELRSDGFDIDHPCGADRYAGRFVLVGNDEWRATWEVEGPRKRLRLEGTYRRIPSTPRAPA